MDGQRNSSSMRRKSKRSRTETKPDGQSKRSSREEPILIAARRPNAPDTYPKRRLMAASAAPRGSEALGSGQANGASAGLDPATIAERKDHPEHSSPSRPAPRREARIVQVHAAGPDDREKQRLKLIDRLLRSEGRVAITRAARELEAAGFEFPVAQDVQLQLLEHFDEGCAHQAICHLTLLLNEEEPIKRPVFEQRLRRLEEFADDAETRQAAANLRRTVRA